MKKLILILVLSFSIIIAKAQSGFNYYSYGVGIGGSYGKAEADLRRQDYHPAFNINFVYNYSPYLPVTLELQKGTFSGGGRTIDLDPSGRIFNNSYFSLNTHADLQLGEIIDYTDNWFLNAVKNFYAGAGIGFIYNHMTDIQRTNLIAANDVIGSTRGFEGKDSDINLIIPLRFGYEFKIFDDYDQPRYGIDIGIQHYYDIGEGIDGYNDDPNKFKNNALDQYTFVTIGVKYNFGTVTAYNKLIRKFQY